MRSPPSSSSSSSTSSSTSTSRPPQGAPPAGSGSSGGDASSSSQLPAASATSGVGAVLRVLHSSLISASCCVHYGLFATMTTVRDEIELELAAAVPPVIPGQSSTAASSAPLDATEWRSVRWRCKPNQTCPPSRSRLWPWTTWPPFHLPRVDWRLWFVSLNLARRLRGADRGADGANFSAGGAGGAGGGGGAGTTASAAKEEDPPALPLPPWVTALLIGIMERQPSIMSLLHADQSLPSLPLGLGGKPDVPSPEKPGKERIRVRLVRYTFPPRPRPSRSSEASDTGVENEGIEFRGRSTLRWDECPATGAASPSRSSSSNSGTSGSGSGSDNANANANDSGSDNSKNKNKNKNKRTHHRKNSTPSPHRPVSEWTLSYPRLVLPPASLEELYLACKPGSSRSIYGKPDKLKPDTAADVIQRAMESWRDKSAPKNKKSD